MPELPRAEIRHITTGRLRLRIPERRRDGAFFGRVRQGLAGWPGVVGVEVNPVTAGVLIHFTGAPAHLLAHARNDDLFRLVDQRAEPAALVDEIREGAMNVDRMLRHLTGGGDLRTAVFLALLAGGIYQLFRGNIAAPAATLLWYAGEAVQIWGPPQAGATAPAPDTAST
jgi:hypothetical protein